MEQTSPKTEPRQEPGKFFEKSPLVELKRVFNAPIERVWKAWSDAELIKQWWGPKEFTAPNVKINFREGGDYLFAMQGSDEKVMWSGGVFQEIVPNKKIVMSDHFSDRNGKAISPEEAGMPGKWPEELTISVTFEKLSAESTEMSLKHEGIPAEMHDDCVKGWSETIDKLQNLVERN